MRTCSATVCPPLVFCLPSAVCRLGAKGRNPTDGRPTALPGQPSGHTCDARGVRTLPVTEPAPPGVAARRAVKRALLGFVVAILGVGLLAYACSRARAQRALTAPPVAAGLALGDTPANDPVARRLLPVGAGSTGSTGSTVRAVYGTGDGRVILVGGPRSALPPQTLVRALTPVTGTAPPGTTREVDGGPLGPLTCAPAPGLGPAGASCLWADIDVVGAVLSPGLRPPALATLTRRLRADVERPVGGGAAGQAGPG